MMRSLRTVLALVFGLAMVGPEAHACPVHSAAPVHHQDGGAKHQKAGHCSCPQACCPAGVSLSLPATASTWTTAALPVVVNHSDVAVSQPLPVRKRLLPFALAPPLL